MDRRTLLDQANENWPRTIAGSFVLCAPKTENMAISWIYLLIASLSESVWLYAVKAMDVKAVKEMGWPGCSATRCMLSRCCRSWVMPSSVRAT